MIEIPASVPSEPRRSTRAMLCHLSSLSVVLAIPLGNIVIPLLLWLLMRDLDVEVKEEGRKSLNFQLTITLLVVLGSCLLFIPIINRFVFWALLGLIAADIFLVLKASVRVYRRQAFSYPFSIEFIRP